MALENISLGDIKTDVTNVLDAVQTVATFVEKFDSVLPPNIRAVVSELQDALTFAEAILAKV